MARDFYEVLGVDEEGARPTRSRRPTASWPARTTPTATPTTRRPRSASRRSRRPTTTLSDPEKRKQYDAGGMFGGFGRGLRRPGGPGRLRPRRHRRHLLDDLRPRRRRRRPRAGRAAATSRPRSGSASSRRWRAPRSRSRSRSSPTCSDLRRQRRRARHAPEGLPALRRPRDRRPEPGLLLDQPALPAVRRPRPGHRDPVPRPAAAPASPCSASATGSTSRPASATAPGSGSPARARTGRSAARRATSSSPPASRPRRSSSSRADGNLEVDVPITVAEAIEGATVEVPTLRGTQADPDPARAPSTAPCSGCAARARRSRGGRERGDIRYRLEIEVPRDLDREQREALDEFAETLNDHDPRERLLRDASAGRGAKVGRTRTMAQTAGTRAQAPTIRHRRRTAASS